MNNIIGLLLVPFLSLQWLLISGSPNTDQIPKHYVIYMGAPKQSANGNEADAKADDHLAHLQLLSSIIPSEERERVSLIHHYHHAIRGFSAMLTDYEASLLAGNSDVVSVIPDEMLELQTTRSWDFLEAGMQSKWGLDKPITTNITIAIIDSGIWPEAESFNDRKIGPIPSTWKGGCTNATNFNSSNCNKKLIGAKYFLPERASSEWTPRDSTGHGTHVAAIAAGAVVTGASFSGFASGTARGGAPSARIASYKVCWAPKKCSSADTLKAIDEALKDGVDIISMSIGPGNKRPRGFLQDTTAIGGFHAEQKGVLVVLAGGNSGPDPYTVDHTAPWMFSVAASTIDRHFKTMVHLGNGKVLTGVSINHSNLSRSPIYPLIYGMDAAINSSVDSKADMCYIGFMDAKKVIGKILVCVDPADSSFFDTKTVLQSKGVILLSKDELISPAYTGNFSGVQVGSADASILRNYYNSSTKTPTATILPTVEVPRDYKPAPVVAGFSSRGPGHLTENLLKPDIMAPGVAILSANTSKTGFKIQEGTSMACPHVSGAAAFIKSVHPTWTPSMIKSALMTTATVYDNTGKPLTNSSKQMASPHEAGAGGLNHMKALDPGLVFETSLQDHFNFLCYYGYRLWLIRDLIDKNITLECPNNSNKELITDINYPSISIGNLSRELSAPRVVKRTVTNVGPSSSTYTAQVYNPTKNLVVKVTPDRIVFSNALRKVPFEVSFDGKAAAKGYHFGHITWSDGNNHSVRVVYAVKVV